MEETLSFTITDDSGFIAIVNAERYHSFVDNDWELPQLFNHFVSEMNSDRIIIWATGSENTWSVQFMDKPSMNEAFREFAKTISVTSGQLFLTNYEDLTMAAQFQDEKLPAQHNAGLAISLDNGSYLLTVRQMYNPDDFDYDGGEKTDFEIIIQPNDSSSISVDNVYWATI